jgi:hypothetical protein
MIINQIKSNQNDTIVTGFSGFIPTHPAANFILAQDHSITVWQLVAILLLSKPGFNPWQATQATK